MVDDEIAERGDALDPEVKRFLDKRSRDSRGSPHDHGPEEARKMFGDLQEGTFAKAPVMLEDIVVDTDTFGQVNLRIMRPPSLAEPSPIVLYLHGGAWVAGSPGAYDRLLRNLAVEAEAAVVFVDFALVPEASYPTQIEQSYAALSWVVREAEQLRLDGKRVAVMGDCSGGNIAAVLALIAKRRRFPEIALQVLLYPIVAVPTDTEEPSPELSNAWLSKVALMSRLGSVFPNEESWAESTAFPGNATAIQLNDLPPALVVVAEHDVVRDGGEQYARQLVEAGVPVTCTRYNGVIHDFMLLNSLSDAAPARSAWDQVTTALRKAFGEPLVVWPDLPSS